MCVIVAEEGDIAAFKNLSAADIGGDAPAAAAPAAAAPSAPPAAAPAAPSGKSYPDHHKGRNLGNTFVICVSCDQ